MFTTCVNAKHHAVANLIMQSYSCENADEVSGVLAADESRTKGQAKSDEGQTGVLLCDGAVAPAFDQILTAF